MWLAIWSESSDSLSAKWFFEESEAKAFRPWGEEPDQIIYVPEGRRVIH